MEESKVSFKNENDLIYGFKSEGSYMPKYSFCKVYKNGVVDFGDGWMIDVDEYTKGRINIPESAVSKIQELIRKNSEIFSTKGLEDMKEYIITDASTETLFFSDGERKKEFSYYNFLGFEDYEEYLSRYPKLAQLVNLYKNIHEILVDAGVGEDFC